MYFKLDWNAVNECYQNRKEKYQSEHPGQYLLIHVTTYKMEYGDPAKDNQGGFADAFKNFRRRHGNLRGEYFGVLIPG